MMKINKKVKIALALSVFLLVTLLIIICVNSVLAPGDLLKTQVVGAALLPEKLSQTSGLYIFGFILLASMVIIVGILGLIVLSRRFSMNIRSKNDNKQALN